MTERDQFLQSLQSYYEGLHEQERNQCNAAARAYALSVNRLEEDRVRAIQCQARAVLLANLIEHLTSLQAKQ